ncbi:MAG: hypothetical protein JHC20_06760 [Pyrobaculum sp.]|nr:hypothetical protein [Pyrobaculum sp.]
MEDIYAPILALLLIYNNSLVLLGPTAWGTGMGPKKAFAVAVVAQLLGVATSSMSPLQISHATFLYIAVLYFLLSLAKISLPVSVVSYAMSSFRPEAVVLWLTSPAASLVAYIWCKLIKRSGALSLLSLFTVMYAFGYNNLALFSRNIVLTAVDIVVGTYLGLGFSRWAADLVALRQRTAVSINLSVAIGALVGILAKIPISFTLVAYSAMLVVSYSSTIRVVKIEKFIRAYLGIVAALLAALIFHVVESQLQFLALRVS